MTARRLWTWAAPDLPRWKGEEYAKLLAALGSDADDELADRYRAFAGSVKALGMPDAIGWLLGYPAEASQDHRENAHVVREIDPDALYDVEVHAQLDMSRVEAWRPFLSIKSYDNVGLMIWDAGSWNALICGAGGLGARPRASLERLIQ